MEDGDSLDFTIISSNFDKDADGTLPFSISSTGELKIEDTDDLIHMAGQTIKLKLSVSDGKGMVANIIGTINLDNKLSLTGTPLANKPGMDIFMVWKHIFKWWILDLSPFTRMVKCKP